MRFSRYISGIHAVIAWLLCPTYRSREPRAAEKINFVTGEPNSAHFCPFALRYISVPRCDQALTSCLTAIKNHWIKYCEKTYEREGINYVWSIKNSTEILNKLKTKGFQASTISTYDFSTLYTTLPHNLIRNQLVD